MIRFFRRRPDEGGIHSPSGWSFALGDRVRKMSGASWQGRVVGFYVTALTAEGYCVESEREPGSVQLYPRWALEAVEGLS